MDSERSVIKPVLLKMFCYLEDYLRFLFCFSHEIFIEEEIIKIIILSMIYDYLKQKNILLFIYTAVPALKTNNPPS